MDYSRRMDDSIDWIRHLNVETIFDNHLKNGVSVNKAIAYAIRRIKTRIAKSALYRYAETDGDYAQIANITDEMTVRINSNKGNENENQHK